MYRSTKSPPATKWEPCATAKPDSITPRRRPIRPTAAKRHPALRLHQIRHPPPQHRANPHTRSRITPPHYRHTPGQSRTALRHRTAKGKPHKSRNLARMPALYRAGTGLRVPAHAPGRNRRQDRSIRLRDRLQLLRKRIHTHALRNTTYPRTTPRMDGSPLDPEKSKEAQDTPAPLSCEPNT